MSNSIPSIAKLGQGAILEAASIEFERVLENIADPNTSAMAKREITVKLVLTPMDDRRSEFRISAVATSKLAPNLPAVTTIFVGRRGGKVSAQEAHAHQPELFDEVESEDETASEPTTAKDKGRALKAV